MENLERLEIPKDCQDLVGFESDVEKPATGCCCWQNDIGTRQSLGVVK